MLPYLSSQLRTIFFLEDYKMIPCLPLKTGTTNWQRALVSLLYVKDGQPILDPNDVLKVNYYLLYIVYNNVLRIIYFEKFLVFLVDIIPFSSPRNTTQLKYLVSDKC